MSIKKLLCVISLMLVSIVTYAGELPAVIFINGIQNSAKDVEKARAAIEFTLNRLNGEDQFEVVSVHNPKGLYDNHELLQLKSSEEVYVTSLRKLACRFDKVCKSDYDAARAVSEHFYNMASTQNSSTSTSGSENVRERMMPILRAVHALAVEIKKHDKSIIVAHSEGNLIANLAFAYLAKPQQMGDDIYKRVRLVNVANTSLVALSGLDLTHDADGALAMLDNLPRNYAFWKRSTPSCNNASCPFTRTKPTLRIINRADPTKIENQVSLAQTTKGIEHGFVGTYLSEKIEVAVVEGELSGVTFENSSSVTFAERFRNVVRAASMSLSPDPRKQASEVVDDSTHAARKLIDKWASNNRDLKPAREATLSAPVEAESASMKLGRDTIAGWLKSSGLLFVPIEKNTYQHVTFAENSDNKDPFFVVGDFNNDGHEDVAATGLISRGGSPFKKFGVVIINGPLEGLNASFAVDYLDLEPFTTGDPPTFWFRKGNGLHVATIGSNKVRQFQVNRPRNGWRYVLSR